MVVQAEVLLAVSYAFCGMMLIKYMLTSFHGCVFGLFSSVQQFGNMAGSLVATMLCIQLLCILSGENYPVYHRTCHLLAVIRTVNLENKVFSIKCQTGVTLVIIGQAPVFILF